MYFQVGKYVEVAPIIQAHLDKYVLAYSFLDVTAHVFVAEIEQLLINKSANVTLEYVLD